MMSSRGAMIRDAMVGGLVVWLVLLYVVWDRFGDMAVVIAAWSPMVIGAVAIVAWLLFTEDESW